VSGQQLLLLLQKKTASILDYYILFYFFCLLVALGIYVTLGKAAVVNFGCQGFLAVTNVYFIIIILIFLFVFCHKLFRVKKIYHLFNLQHSLPSSCPLVRIYS